MPIDARKIAQIVEWAIGVVSQDGTHFADRVFSDPNRQLIAVKLRCLNYRLIPGDQTGERRMLFQLLKISDWGSESH
jgi:hypothetical protein